MRLIIYATSVLAICLCLGSYADSRTIKSHQVSSGGIDDQTSAEVSRIAGTVERIASELGYTSHKSYSPDEWDEDDRIKLLMDHGNYTLLIIDPNDLGPYQPMHVKDKGRIDVQILIFKEARLAAGEIERLKVEHLDNIGAELIKSDANGFQIKRMRWFNVALARGTNVILLQETKDVTAKNIKIIAERLEQEAW